MLGIPLLFSAMNNRKGRAKGVYVWAIMWCQAGLVALNIWAFYKQWSALMAFHNPEYQEAFPDNFVWLLIALTAFLVVCPVVWYYRDQRKERIAAGTA
jgi:hypothetical protein